MPRTPTDATRFTPTTPHAAKPFYPSASNPGPSAIPRNAVAAAAAPAGETPAQKVKRLREAANRAREARLSGFDRTVARGRVWADRAHRITALGLIGFTCIAGVVTVYALGDMMIYNRRKKREYFAEQKAMQDAALQDAEVALRSGRASVEQIALLEQTKGKAVIAEVNERAKEALREGAAKAVPAVEAEKKGILASTTGWLFKGLKKEDTGAAELVEFENSEDERVGAQSGLEKAVEARRAEMAAREREREAGPLDRLGTKEEKGNGGGGWTSFMTRK